MLGNCEKIMTPISSTTNQWPQNQIPLDDHKSLMASSSSSPNKVIMEKINQAADPQPLKCPRCDSSNTKFCYYNNYSLSQPRHFCKACKRYWTRGGTLRNVPVGGGCRKNKKLKRPPQPSSGGGIPSVAACSNPSGQPQIDLSPVSNHIHNPLFYNHPLELNFPFSSYNSARVSSDNNAGFDLQHQMNGLGLGFSSGLRQIQDNHVMTTSNSTPFSSTTAAAGNNNNSIFFGSSAFAASTSTMASLLASSLQHQQKFNSYSSKDIEGVMPYEDAQMAGGNEVKSEGDQNRLAWNPNPNPNPIEQINNSSDPSLIWNTTNVGAWFDPSNMGSSVPSLI